MMRASNRYWLPRLCQAQFSSNKPGVRERTAHCHQEVVSMTPICIAFSANRLTRFQDGKELQGFNPESLTLWPTRPLTGAGGPAWTWAGFQSSFGGDAPNTQAGHLTADADEIGIGNLIWRILEQARGIGFYTYHCLWLPLQAWSCANNCSLRVCLRTISSTKRRGTSTWSFW